MNIIGKKTKEFGRTNKDRENRDSQTREEINSAREGGNERERKRASHVRTRDHFTCIVWHKPLTTVTHNTQICPKSLRNDRKTAEIDLYSSNQSSLRLFWICHKLMKYENDSISHSPSGEYFLSRLIDISSSNQNSCTLSVACRESLISCACSHSSKSSLCVIMII